MTKEEQIKTELYECCVWQQETKITNFLPQKKGHYSYFDFKHNEDSEKEEKKIDFSPYRSSVTDKAILSQKQSRHTGNSIMYP